MQDILKLINHVNGKKIKHKYHSILGNYIINLQYEYTGR